MNYRHDFHAGNFADVLKHVLLTRILLHLNAKPKAYRYIDTHAGSGLYDLSGPQAEKTGEWQSGIARLAAADLSAEAQSLVAPYLKIAAPLLTAEPVLYPGSPSIAKSLMRENDRLLLCELHPAAFAALRDNLGREPRAKLIEIDGYRGLKAFVPPIERRGLVLIDPPFEAADEFETLFEAIEMAWRKWATGIYMIWYPVKDRARVANFMRALRQSSIKRVLRLELQVADVTPEGPLTRCGVIVINPPFPLEAEARILLPSLASCLSLGQNGGIMLEWLAGESGANGLSI